MFTDHYIGLDGKQLCQGDLVEVVGSYVGSEVTHYNGEQGHVVTAWMNAFHLPTVLVHLYRLRVDVEFYPFELIHQDV